MTAVDPDRIIEAVERRTPDMLAFLRELVQTPSVTGSEEGAQMVAARWMRKAGLEVDVWEPDPAEMAAHSRDIGEIESFSGRPNVVGRYRGSGGGRSLILNAHIDVVDPGDPVRWTHPPYAAEVHDGKLYGRGSCDMKAGLAANLFGLVALIDASVHLAGDVIVESVISEEDGGAGTLATLLRGYRADAAIITEPTRLAVIPAQGGSLVFRLHITGKSAHGCVRDEGVSAVEKFALIHRALLEFEARRNRELTHPLYAGIANKVPISIGVVQAGNWPSSVPESLIAEGRAGLVPGEDIDDFCTAFVAEVARAAAEDDWLRQHPPIVEWFSGQFAPAEIEIESPLVHLLAGSHAAATGTEARIDAATYGADMRHFVNFAAIPCVMYGPGDVRVAHYTDEFVPLDEVVTAAKVIALAVSEWCGTGA